MKQKLNCIMLVDDDAITNFLNKIIIINADCALNIKTQQTAKAALNYIDCANMNVSPNPFPHPDLIFLDINMPLMNGWDFLGRYKELKNNHQHTSIIILLSSSVEPMDKIKALGIPEVSGIESKPLTNEIMQEVIAKYFSEYL